MKNPLLCAASVFGLCAALCAPGASHAANFQVQVKRLSAVQCSMNGSILNIDPVNGNVTIDLDTDLNCYPSAVNSLTTATLAVTSSTSIGGGTTGAGTVDLQLNTGLAAVTPGVTCVPDGVVASSVNVTSGWTTTLCTNCGPTATRTGVAVQNPSATGVGTITFKAKCTYQDPSNANLQTVRSSIQSAPTVSVTAGTAPPVNYCQSVSELAVPNGLTDAMRQATGTVTGGTMPGPALDFLNYTSVFGTRAGVIAPGATDNVGFGFPGTNPTNVTFGIQRDKYISWRFRAPSNPVWLEVAGTYLFQPGSAFTLASIAPCPGQFKSDPNFPNNFGCHISAKSSNLIWRVSNTTASCRLVPGNTYYLNVIQANSASDLLTPTCGGGTCPVIISLNGTFPTP